jgi:hypothetical protein
MNHSKRGRGGGKGGKRGIEFHKVLLFLALELLLCLLFDHLAKK